MMDNGTCSECKFWNRYEDSHTGNCRRRSPTNNEGDEGWPESGFFDWCGEYERPVKKANRKHIKYCTVRTCRTGFLAGDSYGRPQKVYCSIACKSKAARERRKGK